MKKDQRLDDNIVEKDVVVGLIGELESLYPSRSKETDITHAWSGIYCDTSDGKPIVGAIKEMPNQYLSVGYNGQGMVKAFSCGRHLAETIAGSKISQPLINKQFDPDRF